MEDEFSSSWSTEESLFPERLYKLNAHHDSATHYILEHIQYCDMGVYTLGVAQLWIMITICSISWYNHVSNVYWAQHARKAFHPKKQKHAGKLIIKTLLDGVRLGTDSVIPIKSPAYSYSKAGITIMVQVFDLFLNFLSILYINEKFYLNIKMRQQNSTTIFMNNAFQKCGSVEFD